MQLGKHQNSKRGQMNERLEICVRHIVDSIPCLEFRSPSVSLTLKDRGLLASSMRAVYIATTGSAVQLETAVCNT